MYLMLVPDSLLLQRMQSKFHAEGDCWLWHGCIMRSKGYGVISINGRNRPAHRIMFELIIGKIPEGLQIDHLCRNRSCINPDHMEPVTIKENVLRGQGITAVNHKKTHCINGHEFTKENTYIPRSGFRNCKQCLTMNSKRFLEKKKVVCLV